MDPTGGERRQEMGKRYYFDGTKLRIYTDLKVKRAEGLWWRRKFLGLYAPTLQLEPDGSVGAVEMPDPESIPPPWCSLP